MFETEDGIDINKPSLQGLQELFTDFDSWTIKFKNIVERPSASDSTKTEKTTTEGNISFEKNGLKNGRNIKTTSRIPLEDLYSNGIIEILKKPHNETCNRISRQTDPVDDFLLDYVIFRLTNGNKFYQIIRSKL
ncbi:hypothetical protein O0L34_g11973 [Tuta absoluta]|nr:hypothetical protein O0L34_g11973 [Tuta absoluta]